MTSSKSSGSDPVDFDAALITQAGHLIATQFGSGALLVDTISGNFIELNLTAATLWELLEKPATRSELCEVLLDRYDVTPEQCAAQVEAWVIDMRNQGLVLIEQTKSRA